MLYWFWEDGSYSSVIVKNKRIILEIVKQFSVAVIFKSHSVKKDVVKCIYSDCLQKNLDSVGLF